MVSCRGRSHSNTAHLADAFIRGAQEAGNEVAQEFIIDSHGYQTMNEGKFCMEAWDAINRYVYAAIQGGSIMDGWTNDEKMVIACCNDGTRPVVFKIERLDEGT